MAIRITGMYSGLDTESIINELASAQSVKKNTLVKAQTRLSWKQDAWKSLNTKIYNFYTNVVDNMRFQASFLKKTTKVSNSNAVSVVTSNEAPNSVQSMKIGQLAKEGYLTSGRVSKEGEKQYSEETTLAEMGFSGQGSFRVKVGNKTTDITIKEDMKISDVVKKLQSAGLNASFDVKNQRFYLSSKSSGLAADFTITSNDGGGQNLLTTLGFAAGYDVNSNEYKEYKKWADYGLGNPPTQARLDAEKSEVAKLIAAKKASTDSLLKTNEELQKKLDKILEEYQKNGADPTNNPIDYDPDDKDKINAQVEELMTKLYGEEVEVQKKDKDGNPMFDDNNQPIMVKERNGKLPDGTDSLKTVMDKANEELKTAKNNLEELKKNGASEADIAAAQADVEAKTSAAATAKADFDKTRGYYSYVNAVANAQNAIEENKATIADNRTYYEVDGNGEPVLDADKKLQASQKAKDEITAYFDSKIQAAQEYVAKANDFVNGTGSFAGLTDEQREAMKSQMAVKIDGQDAEIYLNNVKYTSKTNTFDINGLTITVNQETNEEITMTTTDDTDGIYDMVKNFFTEYNKLINEMDKLYNAEANKGFDPLLSEEKAAMSDNEIEEWEAKVKESLLRRDSTLSTVSGAMKSIMLAGVEVNGKQMYLSDFGINTLGYFNAKDNEKSAYHIDGDKDDPNTKSEDDVLRAMIASDPDTVMKFFTGLSNNLHGKLNELMASSTSSSAFTVYNDKDMKTEYDDYTEKISKQETKLNSLIDKWYAKFSSMETALARLESKSSAVTSMLGG